MATAVQLPWEKYAAQPAATEEGPWSKYAAPVQPSGPTQFEKDRSGGEGFLSNVGQSLGARRAAPPSKLEMASVGIPALGVIKGLYDTAMSAPRHAREEYAADKGMNPLGRIAAAGGAALAPMLGIDPDRMRASSEKADTAGVLGQIVVPAAMAMAPLASRGAEMMPTGEEIGDAIGRTLRTPGKINPDTGIPSRGPLKPSVRAVSSIGKLIGGPQIADAFVPAHPNPVGWSVPLPGNVYESPGGALGRIGTQAPATEEPLVLIPEPRTPFEGENAAYMGSVPRDEVTSLAKAGKPGAGKQLQQLGRKVLYVPK